MTAVMTKGGIRTLDGADPSLSPPDGGQLPPTEGAYEYMSL
ncbi:hypothetical protein Tam10B_1697 [Bifidobacterium vansinderenii]|uniref:Uncharacterized protein n=1 Tax=Bifidobacterium vansinderenii TaxID=1984871 RepID=A0A229VWT2_9BIFI|nr:hypothetical protein Tam10B_1697 [Bifidobacterium vansinderenii]